MRTPCRRRRCQALRARGLSPVSPDSARLLRSTPSGGKAWVVPVPDVVARFAWAALRVPGPGRARAWPSWRRATPRAAAAARSTTSSAGARPSPSPRAPAPTTRCSRSRGSSPTASRAAFLTAPDGTAVRADVKDNGYEFLLPNQRTPEQRYVVWTGGDGRPTSSPSSAFGAVPAEACKAAAKLPAVDGARVARRPVPVRDATDRSPRSPSTPCAPAVARAASAPSGGAAALRHALLGHAGPFAPGVSCTGGRPLPVPPLAVPPARPVAPPSVRPPARRPAPSAAPPVRKHR